MKLKRSREVNLTILLTIIASITAGCDEPKPPAEDLKHCVDSNGIVVEEEKCKDSPSGPAAASSPSGDGGTSSSSTHHSGGGGGHFWYYGGAGTPLSPGARATGGSSTPSVGKSYSTPSVSRGGFGATGGGHAGGAGE